jgi:AAA+ ATPase superfamily predicted ATPase
MENQVLGYKSPLYGRRTAQFKIEPLDYYDVADYFHSFSLEKKLLAYGVTGGIPQYINTFLDETKDRVRQLAAPIDAKRLEKNTPCTKVSYCVDWKHE